MPGYRKAVRLAALMIAVAPAAIGNGDALAKDYLVKNQKAYAAAVKKARPGDDIILAKGEWQDFQIVFEAAGTEGAPITLRAEVPGEVFITGQSNLRIGGEHLAVSGLTFKDGYSPTDEVISFRRDSKTLSNSVQFTENVIERFNKPDRATQDSWVVLYGRDNVVANNAFVGKTNKGPTMIVRLNTPESQENNHRIEKNFFGGRPPLGGNGGETLRVGTSHFSRTTSSTVIRHNYFEHCDGEVEIISIKAQDNLVTENVFFESRGSVVFRHGGRNTVSRNVFFGNGVPDTGGIRVINDNQTVVDNYLEGVTGQKFLGALVVMNGVPNSPQNRYHQVENAQIANNSFINISHIGLGVGSDDERSAVPIDSRVKGNIFVSTVDQPVGVFDDMSGISFVDNVATDDRFSKVGAAPKEFEFTRAANGLLYPTEDSGVAEVGAPRDLTPVSRDETGPRFHRKDPVGRDGGTTHEVGASEQALKDALKAAANGDTIALPKGQVTLSAPITLRKAITISGQGTQIVSAQNGAFRLAAGADLSLSNVGLVQTSADTAYFHAVGARYEGDYRLDLRGVVAVGGNGVEAVAPLIAADPETFAREVTISGATVSGWPGAVVDLSGKGLDGWYLTDDLRIADSQFTDVAGALVSFGREGRDESTFGPRFALTGSSLSNVGEGEIALELHGIDGLDISGNRFERAGPLMVKRRVLGFPFGIDGNQTDGSATLVVRGVADEMLAIDLEEGAQ